MLRRRMPISSIVLIIALFLFPLVVKNTYVIRVLTFANVFAILACSWDIVGGYTGQISFGNALFFGIAGYTLAFMTKWFGFSPWPSLFIGGGVAALCGLLMGVVCLRLKGPYLALVTLAVPLVLIQITHIYWQIFGADEGITGVSPLAIGYLSNYYISLVLMLFTIISLSLISNSRLGLIFLSIREDELVAEAVGVNTTKYKILAFVLSAFFSGLAGAFHTSQLMYVLPDYLSIVLSTNIVMWSVIGGLGSIIGPAFIAYFLTVLGEVLRVVEELRLIISSTTAILILLFYPGGAMQFFLKVKEVWGKSE